MKIVKIMMVYDIDERLEILIKLKAKSEGLSVNETTKKLLETALGVNYSVDIQRI